MFLVLTATFTAEMSITNIFHHDFNYYVQIPIYWMLMLLATYFIKRVLIEFFLLQSKAENTRDALTKVLDNLPDGVLMLEDDQLSYCNQQADSFFGVKLSDLNSQPDKLKDFRSSQYLLLRTRCMHELKTMETGRVAEKMNDDDDGSKSICVTELGQSVLTLQEVVQTFEKNSPLYNIKLSEDDPYRTV